MKSPRAQLRQLANQTITDGENNLTTFEYDGHDRLAKTRFPSPARGAGTSSTTDYEQPTYESLAGGTRTSHLVAAFRNRANETILFTYDALGRLTFKDLPGAELDVSFGYDLLGRMSSASTSGQSLAFAYDALGRQRSQTEGARTYSFDYDLAGRRIRITHPDGFFVDQDYLVTGELTRIRENGATSGIGVLATYDYDALGRRDKLTLGNGNVTDYRYDAVSRLDQLVHDAAGTGFDNVIALAYNPAGQIVGRAATNDVYAWTGHGNGSTAYAPDGPNRLTSQTTGGSTLAFSHDARSNRLNDASRTYTYDSENKARGVATAPLHYDPLGRLSGAGNAIGSPPLLAYESYVDNLVAERTPGSASVGRRHVFGPGADEPIVWYEGAGTADRRFLQADERGSIVAVSDAGGAVQNVNRYDEYGRTQNSNPYWLSRFAYTGQRYFGGFGLYHYKNRMYDPAAGRFMQPDPIGYGGGTNLYAYAGADPVNLADPNGLTPSDNCTGTRLCHHDSGSVSGSVQVFGDINGFRERGNSSGGTIDLVEVNIYDINDLSIPINTWWEFRMDGLSFGSFSMDSFNQQRCPGGSVCPDSSPEAKRRYSETLRAIYRTPAVFKQMVRAWQASNPYGNRRSKTEYGFWIFEAYGQYAPGKLLTGEGDAVWAFEYRPVGANIFFHTHPFTAADGYIPWLSGKDHNLADYHDIMIIAYTHAGFVESDYRRRR